MIRPNRRNSVILLPTTTLSRSVAVLIIFCALFWKPLEQIEALQLEDRWTSRKQFLAVSEARDTVKTAHHPQDRSYSRREIIFIASSLAGSSIGLCRPSGAVARNLPTSNGADTSKTGTIQALVPILELRNKLETLRQQLKQDGRLTQPAISILAKTPQKETDFKRVFDAYSDPVSYKQKFLDQNAFLVYYTQGYDGPGRKSMEADVVNERQTLQFGARNEAWLAWESFLAEQEYYVKTYDSASATSPDEEDDFAELVSKLYDTIREIDTYLKLSPPEDVAAANDLLQVASLS
ncbi:hypothetical protein IV203_003364 [Nitzschia inconspicua]|uniref:Uncharacterized protein n=1 Tax=Nitzschia inconspicua TaxID=303405 RepID=A0A9K3K4X5_9STRA|nr:hypothetical protein IV203_017536 [Nitzschia inconspicua]KAG7354008.1 hypothetical protein IV203_003364 [Nitzschia inconspicua]